MTAGRPRNTPKSVALAEQRGIGFHVDTMVRPVEKARD